MITTWSPYNRSDDQDGGAKRLFDYLTLPAVRKPTGSGANVLLSRDPAPETLAGNASIVRAAISAMPWTCRYSAVTLGFTGDDVNVSEFNTGEHTSRQLVGRIIALFQEVAFAGIRPEFRPPTYICTHSHTGRLELNIVLPRYAMRRDGQSRAFNPNPPKSGGHWQAFTDTINHHFQLDDPLAPERRRLVALPNWLLKIKAEAERQGFAAPTDPRLQLATVATELFYSGAVTNRADLLLALAPVLTSLELEIRQVSRNSIGLVAREKPKIEPLRLRGYLFSKDFGAEPDESPVLPAKRLTSGATSYERITKVMASRALYHNQRYGGNWPVPDPLDILAGPPVPMPSHYPRVSAKRGLPAVASRVAGRFAQMIDLIRERLSEAILLDALSAVASLTTIRQRMEILNERTFRSDDDNALRLAGDHLAKSTTAHAARTLARITSDGARLSERQTPEPDGGSTRDAFSVGSNHNPVGSTDPRQFGDGDFDFRNADPPIGASQNARTAKRVGQVARGIARGGNSPGARLVLLITARADQNLGRPKGAAPQALEVATQETWQGG